MALIRTNGGAGASALTVFTSERQSREQTTIDLTGVKYFIVPARVDSQDYTYVYDVEAGTWNVSPAAAYTASVSGNTMTITPTNIITYFYYVTIGK